PQEDRRGRGHLRRSRRPEPDHHRHHHQRGAVMSFSQAWQNAANETIEPSKGTYNVRIAGGNAFTSQAGDDYAKLELEIVTAPAGAHVNGSPDKPIGPGSRFEHFMGFKHEVGARINREALITYGLENP